MAADTVNLRREAESPDSLDPRGGRYMGNPRNNHNRGQHDGAAYKKQGVLDSILNPRYKPPRDPGAKKSYDKGHKHGRKSGWF